MKKYLVTGLAAVAISGMFTSCTHENDTAGGSSDLGVVETYEKAFISRFGTPSPNADWGFGSSTANTRALTRAMNISFDYWDFPEDANANKFLADVPEGVEKLGFQAFYACQKLTDIDLPLSLKEIGGNAGLAFEACTDLEKGHFVIKDLKWWCSMVIKGIYEMCNGRNSFHEYVYM